LQQVLLALLLAQKALLLEQVLVLQQEHQTTEV
jgi:hypothetical protein